MVAFGLSIEQREETAVVTVSGALDLYTAPRLRTALMAVTAPRLLVDLTAATYIDAAGLGVLVVAVREARKSNGTVQVRVENGSPVQRMIQLTRLDRIVEMVA